MGNEGVHSSLCDDIAHMSHIYKIINKNRDHVHSIRCYARVQGARYETVKLWKRRRSHADPIE